MWRADKVFVVKGMDNFMNECKKVTVAMSGGIDSAVAALLAIGNGYDASGATMRLCTKLDENGNDKTYDYPNKERNEMADRFVSEVSGKLSTDLWIPDFDDLNKRLGLL